MSCVAGKARDVVSVNLLGRLDFVCLDWSVFDWVNFAVCLFCSILWILVFEGTRDNFEFPGSFTDF